MVRLASHGVDECPKFLYNGPLVKVHVISISDPTSFVSEKNHKFHTDTDTDCE